MALLAAPLVNEGTLYFAPKGRLVRHITAPAPATVLIDEGSLRFADAGGSETLSLAQNPVLRLFVDSFVKIFAGDRVALERMYTMELQALPVGADGVARWSLGLRPRVAPMTQIIERFLSSESLKNRPRSTKRLLTTSKSWLVPKTEVRSDDLFLYLTRLPPGRK